MAEQEKKKGPLAEPLAWDLVSGGYEKYTREFLGKFSEEGLARLGLKKDDSMLDVACGPGTTSLLAAGRVKDVQGLDFSEQMLDQFRSNIQKQRLQNVRVQQGDGQALPFEDESFDVAVSMFGLMFFPLRTQGMRELVRTLRPGGRALVASWAPVHMSPLMEIFISTMRVVRPETAAPEYDLDSLENPELFEKEMREAGFSEVSIEPVLRNYAFESGGAFWDEMVEGMVPLVLLRRSVDEEEWRRISEKCRAHLEKELQGIRELGSTAYLAIAKKGA